MKNILAIGHNELRLFLKSRTSYLWLFVLPLAFVAMALVAMAYWFAPLLVVLNGEEPIAALKKSFRACWQNLGAVTIYGLILIGLAIVAAIPLGLGFLVLVPVMAGSWYASWREMFDA